VWDYPRPPTLEQTGRHVVVELGGEVIADTRQAWRVCETSHPPVYYVPMEDARTDLLVLGQGSSCCEWKGRAVYWDAVIDGQLWPRVAWSYPGPDPRFERLRGHLAFYLQGLDAGFVDDERARPQPGGFYGGWITDDVVGPFKGGSGTAGW
jgi:uncharacterized protein (DUF427 family)